MAEDNPWVLVQGKLRTVLDEHSYKNWFAPTHFERYQDGRLVVGVPSQFFAEWLRDHYMDAVSESVRAVLPDFEAVEFIPTGSPQVENLPAPTIGSKPAPAPNSGPSPARTSTHPESFKGFNNRYSFRRFVIGAGNRFAHAAAKAVAEGPGRAYNPLFLYGGTGLGKTHLMQAIGLEILERNRDANVLYMSSEQFTNQLVESIAKKSTLQFRNKYRKVDVLLIDDIHFIAGKEATQEEFFHTFNALFDQHKQIVLSSDRGPKEIQRLEDRLVSRFEWGLVTDIQAPDLETRMAILQSKADEENVSLPPTVVKFIATHVVTNIRELEGALITVLAYGTLTGREITISLVEEVIADLVGSDKIKPVTVEAVQRAVAEHFDVRLSDLRGSSRQRQIAFPRQIAMYLCKKLIPSLSLQETGHAFGGRDHTTVLYACQKVKKDIESTRETAQTVAVLEKSLRS